MRRSLTPLLVLLLLASTVPFARAQQGAMEYFEEFDGLQRVVARNWMAPITFSSSSSAVVEINEEGTPTVIHEPVSTPSATPERQSDIGQFTVFVFLFDSENHASAGFDRIDEEQQEQTRRDPRSPLTNELPLDGVGDQAIGYTGEITQDDVTVTYTSATVQDGSFVYDFFAMTAEVDVSILIEDAANALIGQPMNRMAEQFDPNGGSRGGIWSKLDSLHPDVPDTFDVTDLVIYPVPEATPGASPVSMVPRLDLDHPDSIDGLATLDRRTYILPGEATPAPDQVGVFRIDTWILTFNSNENADAATTALGNTLIEPFIIVSGGASAEATSTGESTSDTSWYEGYIDDRSFPPGKGIVSLLHFNESVYAVVVYAVEEDPKPVADTIMRTMTADSTIPPNERFPEAGDPVLQGLVPDAIVPQATPEN